MPAGISVFDIRWLGVGSKEPYCIPHPGRKIWVRFRAFLCRKEWVQEASEGLASLGELFCLPHGPSSQASSPSSFTHLQSRSKRIRNRKKLTLFQTPVASPATEPAQTLIRLLEQCYPRRGEGRGKKPGLERLVPYTPLRTQGMNRTQVAQL